jgi:hypothetical protein
MNYSDLAIRLSQLGERLAKKSDRLEGEDLGRSAAKLVSCLSPSSKRHLSVPLLKRGLREICTKRLKSEELSAAKREFVELVHTAGKQDQAAEFLQNAFAESVHVESGGKDKALLQREFIHLGQLLDEEFAVEIGSRTLPELRRIAAVNGIRFTAKTDRYRLTALIRRYAQRAAFNVAAARVPSRI